MNNNFSCDTSEVAWRLFKDKGQIGFIMLYLNLEDPSRILDASSYKDEGVER